MIDYVFSVTKEKEKLRHLLTYIEMCVVIRFLIKKLKSVRIIISFEMFMSLKHSVHASRIM